MLSSVKKALLLGVNILADSPETFVTLFSAAVELPDYGKVVISLFPLLVELRDTVLIKMKIKIKFSDRRKFQKAQETPPYVNLYFSGNRRDTFETRVPEKNEDTYEEKTVSADLEGFSADDFASFAVFFQPAVFQQTHLESKKLFVKALKQVHGVKFDLR